MVNRLHGNEAEWMARCLSDSPGGVVQAQLVRPSGEHDGVVYNTNQWQEQDTNPTHMGFSEKYPCFSLNPLKPEFTIVIFIHYKPRIAVVILDL